MDVLLASVREFTGDHRQTDDMPVLVRYRGAPP